MDELIFVVGVGERFLFIYEDKDTPWIIENLLEICFGVMSKYKILFFVCKYKTLMYI